MALQQGLWTLANTMAQPAQLSGAQQALSSPLTQSINPEDPYSLRDAAKHAMNKGDVMTGQKYMQQAADVEQRKAEERMDSIRNTYAKMKASGNAEAFEKGMIDSGQADLIAQIKEEDLQREVAMATGNSALDQRAVQEWGKKYFAAGPKGRQIIAEQLKREDKGDILTELQSKERAIKSEEIRLAANESIAADRERAARVNSKPIPETEADIMKQVAALPPEDRALYIERVKDRLAERKAIKDYFEKDPKGTPSPNILSLANMDEQAYRDLVALSGREVANKMVVDKAYNTPPPKENDLVRVSSATQETLRAAIEQAMAEPDTFWGEGDLNEIKAEYEDGPSVEERLVQGVGVIERGGALDEALAVALGKAAPPATKQGRDTGTVAVKPDDFAKMSKAELEAFDVDSIQDNEELLLAYIEARGG
jgi:hypothetical protein